MTSLAELPAWQALARHRDELAGRHLRQLFADDPERVPRLTAAAAGLFLDYSKQRLDARAVELLLELARARGLPAAIEAMFAGEPINAAENRAAWHVALRAPPSAGYPEKIHRARSALDSFAEEIRAGDRRGFTGERITDVVNIGIGGSDLGPRLLCEALAPPRPVVRAHFVANVDPAELDAVLARLRPQTTLFAIASKSFATAETMANARAALAWLRAGGAGEGDIARHAVAATVNRDAPKALGIDTVFPLWDWVGGRFSLWSAVGLPVALCLGTEAFRELLAGAHAMDEHFRRAPLERNLPALLGLVGIWNRNLLRMPGLVVAPYASRLERLPTWLQQVEMESNGKSVTADGDPVAVDTVPAVWGGVGTNVQHAFFQMLHQGSEPLPVDFVLPLPETLDDERQRQLAANCLAQSEALMAGRDDAGVRAALANQGLAGADLEAAVAQRRFPGNRPSSTLLLDGLSPHSLGALLAAYEHKVYVQGVIWGINSFDQWGVELGKTLAGRILEELEGGAEHEHDASTRTLIGKVRRGR